MDTQIAQTETLEPEILEIEPYPFVKDVVPGSMSGAEMLAYWEANGVFDVPWPQHDEIGEGKRFEDSTEYIQHKRQRAEYRSH